MQVNILLWNSHVWQETLSPKQTCMLLCGSPEIYPLVLYPLLLYLGQWDQGQDISLA